ncbi:MAG TPA: phospholipase C, phosphocholine-specific [Terracidiphilus sp.]|nr:phospholipase C, phosphocholine-specific [Terracidiphilus sp.]
MHTRRDFLKLAAMLSGASAVSGFIPESIQRAYAISAEPGSTFLDAEHIVILMQENRSFDHALGTLRGVRGFNDPRAIRLANGNSVFVQTDAAGDSYAPWRLDIKDTRITWMGSIPHSRNSQVDAWNGGRQDGWIDAKRSGNPEYSRVPMTMGHYTREDIPFYYALADAFTVCDQNYCAVMSSTTPNRSTFWTGTIRDRQSVDSRVYMRNEQYERLQMPWKTYPERLQEAGISWKFYQNELTYSGLTGDHDAWLGNFGCNVLEFFRAYNIEAYTGFPLALQAECAGLKEEIGRLEEHASKETNPDAVARLHTRIEQARNHIKGLQAQIACSGAPRYDQLSGSQRALFHSAFVTNAASRDFHELEELPFTDDGKAETMAVPKGDIFYQFRKDVMEGTLPTISWMTAPEKFSDHPTSPWYGAWYVSEVMDILTKNPEVWKKTIFILTYDENDGYFDHAPSYVAADPKRPETGGASEGIDTGIEYTYAGDELAQGVTHAEARSGPIGMGFRVPMIIASPWTRGGWVNSQLFDHTSTLMFLESFIGGKLGKTVREENVSSWRRAVAGDLTSAFRPFDGQEPQLDYLNRDRFVIGIERARYKEIPSNYKRLNSSQIKNITQNARQSSFTSHQEPGTRPACALPYELYAEWALTPDGTQFELQLTSGDGVHGSSAAGAPFNVYLRNLNNSSQGGFQAATYAVKAGSTLRPRFPVSAFAGSKYVVEIHAPNGFYRSFAGTPESRNLRMNLEYEKEGSGLTGNIVLHLKNTQQEKLAVAIADNSYETGTVRNTLDPNGEAAVVLRLERSHGWYDFTVTVDESDAEWRYAGRVETGRPSFSDPSMAKSV